MKRVDDARYPDGVVPLASLGLEGASLDQTQPLRGLLIEDSEADAEFVSRALLRVRPGRFEITHEIEVEAGLKRLRDEQLDFVLLDLSLPGFRGFEALRMLLDLSEPPTVVVLSGDDDRDLALRAIRYGAQDFLVKGLAAPELLARSIEHSIERKMLTDELVKAQAKLQRQVLIDSLTGVANRRGLDKTIASYASPGEFGGGRLCAVLLDVDDFKEVNTRWGHGGGDVVLRSVADALRIALRPTDEVGRVGGDEFLVLLPDLRVAEGLAVAERLRRRVCGRSVTLQGQDVKVTVSAGVVAVGDEASSIDRLMRVADGALAASKRYGKNQCRAVLSSQTGSTRAAPTYDLDHVVTGLRAFYQPIVRAEDRQILGAELLIRGPVGAYESPIDLLQAAHEAGVLEAVDSRCLEVCAEGAASLGSTHCFLNIFPTTLTSVSASRLLACLEVIEDREICLELSEQQLVGASPELFRRVMALREEGVRFAIDDIGFGRSSLESLITLEPEYAKIDRSLVTGAADDAVRLRRLERLAQVLTHLETTCIAEGIETRQDLDVVIGLEIPLVQGYWFGRPARVEPSLPPPRQRISAA